MRWLLLRKDDWSEVQVVPDPGRPVPQPPPPGWTYLTDHEGTPEDAAWLAYVLVAQHGGHTATRRGIVPRQPN